MEHYWKASHMEYKVERNEESKLPTIQTAFSYFYFYFLLLHGSCHKMPSGELYYSA